jgi:hypothetical protein
VRCACAIWLAVALILQPRIAASAQITQQALIISGRVTGPGETPIPDARVVVRPAGTGASDSTTTDSTGWYRITVAARDSLTVSVKAVGFASLDRSIVRPNSPLRDITIDFALSTATTVLQAVKVKALRPILPHPEAAMPRPAGERDAHLSVGSGASGDVTGSVDAALAMIDGILPSPQGSGTASTAFGLPADQNGATLNGADATVSVPRDGPRRSVRLSTYDPKIGRFSGVQIATQLQSGTDYRSRTLHGTLDTPTLEWPTAATSRVGGEYQNAILSGAMSGPIRPGKTLYSTAYQLGRYTSRVSALNNASSDALDAFGLTRDSVDKLLATAKTLGVSSTAASNSPWATTTDASVMARVDFTPAAEPFITGDPDPEVYMLAAASIRASSGLGIGITSLPSRATHSSHRDGLLQFDYAPYLLRALDETKVTVSASEDESQPDVPYPGIAVLLDAPQASDSDSGHDAATWADLGGNGNSQRTNRWQVEVSHDVSWTTIARTHTFDVYAEGEVSHLDQLLHVNSLGTFTFRSLSDFERGQAASFTRQFSSVPSGGSTVRAVLALSDTYLAGPVAHPKTWTESQYGDGLRLQYGARLELERFGERAGFNAEVASAFARRNDHLPNSIAVLPMAGFTWTRGMFAVPIANGVAIRTRNTISGGVREYRAPVSQDDINRVAGSSGLPEATQQISCVGPAVPLINWRAYALSPTSIPAECRDALLGSAFVEAGAPIVLFARDFSAARSWRGELNWDHTLSSRLDGKLSVTHATNIGGIEPYDLNLDATRRFALHSESDRPVFVSPSAIDPASGAVSTSESRRSADFANVIELRSRLRSWQQQLTGRIEYEIGPSNFGATDTPNTPAFTGSLQASYTYARGRAETSGFSGTTGAEPRIIVWAPAAIPTHTLKLTFTGHLKDWFSVSAFASLYSGFPYTPMVVGDINGDGYSNDRAFVFKPTDVADASLRAGMADLLTSAPRRAKDCLTAQLGSIAANGSCIGPWSVSLPAIAVELDPYRLGFGNRGSISVYIDNPLGALDRLVHTDAHLRGWGTPAVPDPRLLTVRGFDVPSGTFLYTVNPRFGRRSTVGQPPFRITLDVRLDIGPNRETEAIAVQMRRASEMSGVSPPRSADIAHGLEAMARLYGNTDFTMLRRNATALGLDSTQSDSIFRIIDAYSASRDSIYAGLAVYLAAHATSVGRRETRDQWHAAIATAIALSYRTAVRIRALLTPDQIAQVRAQGGNWVDDTPEWLRNELRKPLMPH